MIKAGISASRLEKALQAVTVLVDAATIRFGPDGLRVQTVDPSNVGEISMTLMSNAFSNYEAEGESISIDVERISNIIGGVDEKEEISILFPTSNQRLNLNTQTYEFDISLFDPDSVKSGKGPIDIDPPSMVEIDSDEILEAINLARMFSNEIVLGIDESNEVFYMNAQGDSDTMAVSFSRDDDCISGMTANRAHTTFGINHLAKMISVAPPGETVVLEIGEEFPAKIHFDIANENGRVTYGLAPRIV